MCPASGDTPLPIQLQYLYLEQNRLVGTLPESWSNLSKVSYWHELFISCYSLIGSLAKPCTITDVHSVVYVESAKIFCEGHE